MNISAASSPPPATRGPSGGRSMPVLTGQGILASGVINFASPPIISGPARRGSRSSTNTCIRSLSSAFLDSLGDRKQPALGDQPVSNRAQVVGRDFPAKKEGLNRHCVGFAELGYRQGIRGNQNQATEG